MVASYDTVSSLSTSRAQKIEPDLQFESKAPRIHSKSKDLCRRRTVCKIDKRTGVLALTRSLFYEDVEMTKSTQDVADAELAVLKVLWKERSATVRHIAETLYETASKSQHSTVQKLLDRLKAKGFVARDKTIWPHVFRPAVQESELIDRRLQQTADKFCGGSMQPLLTHLLRGRKLSKEDRSSLRGLLNEYDAEAAE